MIQKQLSIHNINEDYAGTISNTLLAESLGFGFVEICQRLTGNKILENFKTALKDFECVEIGDKIFFKGSHSLVICYTDVKRDVFMYAKTFDDLVKTYGLIRKNFERDKGRLEISYYFIDSGISRRTIRPKTYQKIYTELYPNINIEKLLNEFVVSPENILLLYGDPGTGKTSLIKYFINAGIFEHIAYAKDKAVFENSGFWPHLINDDIDLLILDDLDFQLKSRDENSNDFMGNLLSFSDGALNNKTKILITTNQKVDEIDSALIRPGRCFDFLVLNCLTNEQAHQIWINTLKKSPEDFARIFGKKQVSQAALVSEANRLANQMNERSYVRDSNNKYSIEQKIEQLGIKVRNNHNLGFG